MGLPVVAPALEPLQGMPGIRPCPTRSDFVRAIAEHGRAQVAEEDVAGMRAFSKSNSWGARVDRLLEIVAAESDGAGTGAGPATPSPVGAPDGVPPARTVGASAVHVGARLSVVVPSFNHERWVGAAVGSAAAQTLAPAEIVVVDDGSTDGSRDVLASLTGLGVRVILQENRGAHHALNRAITLARGEWVAILNSDDLFDPARLEHAWGVARATGAALVCGAVRLISEDGGEPDPGHDIVRWYAGARAFARGAPSLGAALARHNVAVSTSNLFLHRELWRRVGGFRSWRYVHDWDFLLRAAALCPRSVLYEDALCDVSYRVHGANTISENLHRARAERTEMLRTLHGPASRARLFASRPASSRAVRRAAREDGVLSLGVHVPASRVDAVGMQRGEGDASRSPHVGIVVASLGAGGLEETVALLAQVLPSVGMRVSILCTGRGGPIADRLRAAGVDVRVDSGGGSTWVEWARGTGVDVVSSHFAPGEVVAALASEGFPVVETVQNSYAWFTPADWREEREKATRLAGVVAVSDVAAEYYLRHAGRKADAIVPNAVHPGRAAVVPLPFARARLGVAPDVPLFVSVARLTQQKNPAGLVRAFARARERVPDARLLLFGPRERSGGLSRLRATHAELFRSGAVRHAGVVGDVGTALCGADAFVSNSFYEGWSLSASEALWVGVPVVLSETGGARELVGTAGERGILVPNPCGDPLRVDADAVASPPPDAREANERGFADALVRVALERGAWRGRSEGIRSFARAELGPDVFARRWAEALRTILGRVEAG
jgi:glycosyltransferase involved in cell wall biosynthesis